ncbi:MAG: glycosyltransferase family 4 protein [Verrucomicrobiota bacterium]|nr:glycosyltransferase family 4 protein [Verrucomicrobiota bacterium]
MDAAPVTRPLFFITHEFYPKRGGIATFTEEIAKASASLGFDVEVWAQSAPPGVEKPWPFRLRRLPLKGTHDLACQFRLALQLIAERRRLRYATVYLPEPGPMLAMMLLQFLKSFRPQQLILTFHGSEILKFHRNPLTRILARRLIRHATRISTLTNYTHRLLCNRFPQAVGKTFLTPGALRSDFAIVAARRPAAKDKIIILTVGRLHARKGQLVTLHALQALPENLRARIEYWLVGNASQPDYERVLRAAAARSGFVVRFFENVPDDELSHIYDRADIFAMTSIELSHSIEGFGLVYLEAAAHGLPVIGHKVGGVSEAVAEGETGLLVPPHDPAQLTAAFKRLIVDADFRHRLGTAGREWARRNCWQQAAGTLFETTAKPAAV